MDKEEIEVEIGGKTPENKGIIYSERGIVIIGPIRSSAVGKTVTVEIIDGTIIRCKTDSIRPDGFRWESDYPNCPDDLDRGEIFETKINSASDSLSNPSVSELAEGRLQLGPLEQSVEGRRIPAQYQGGGDAICLEPKYVTEKYDSYISNWIDHHSSPSIDPQIYNISNNTPENIRSKETVSESKATPDEGSKNTDPVDEPVESEASTDENTDMAGNSAEPEDNSKSRRRDGNTSTSEMESFEGEDRGTSVEELREQAYRDSSEEISNSNSRKIRSKSEYTRSSKIRRYVKQRANGYCEGCGDPAPFNSKTGEPYLHAHHVHELSDGGKDTPDTVIALCPNCHYRVHDRIDGDEYNQKLLEIVKEKEKDQV
jgi:5-methylcytosine-specific restriction endonuclease McrA